MELTADWSNRKVKVKQMAPNNTSIDGSDLGQSKEAILHVNSTLFILAGKVYFEFIVHEFCIFVLLFLLM